MSIKLMTAVLDHSPYKGSALLVHLVLADWANEDGECFPHLPTLIKRTRVSRPVVYRTLNLMKIDGLLTYDGENLSKPSRDVPFVIRAVSNRDDPVSNRDKTVSDRDETSIHTSHIRTVREPPCNRVTDVTGVTSSFDAFWEGYPKKVGKGDARRAYARALKKIEENVILSGCLDYAASRRGQEKRYTLNPATWLNQERWDDEIQTTSRVGILPDAPMPEWMKKIAKEEQ